MKDTTLIDSPLEWQKFFYWWNSRENLTFGEAIEQWKKRQKTIRYKLKHFFDLQSYK